MPKKTIAPDYSNDAVFEIGAKVVVQQPNALWAGYSGTVISVTNGLHRLCIMWTNGMEFHADVRGNELKSVL